MAIRIAEISAAEYKVNTINSIKRRYPALRQKSKAPS